jgi:hypothetical protein
MDCVSGEAGEVHKLAQNVVLGHSGRELQIADADGATRVGGGDQFRGNAVREGFSPQERATAGKEKYTTHASPWSVRSAVRWGGLGYNFINASGAGWDFGGQPFEVREEVMDMAPKAKAPSVGALVPQRLLQDREETPRARDGQTHGPEFAQNLVPFPNWDSLLSGQNGIQYLLQTFHTMQREFQSLGHRIEDPAQDGLSGSPGSVPFEELLKGSRLLAMGAVLVVQASENSVQSVEKSALYSKPAV